MIYDQIINDAKQSNKNILILASPRSGTHALGEELATLSGGTCLGEICRTGYCDNFWAEFNNFANNRNLTVAQIVQLVPKLELAENVAKIKEKTLVVSIRRRDKINQFASWLYFRVLDPTALHGWHNHKSEDTRTTPGSIAATKQDIDQFKLEQLIDDFFLPDYSLCYEDVTFNNQRKMQINQFAFPLKEIFSNRDFVEQALGDWQYSQEHFYDKR